MGETQVDPTSSESNGHNLDEFQVFISTSRTGRRNAVTHIVTDLGEKINGTTSQINVSQLAQQLHENLKTHGGDDGNTRGQGPSTSKSADLDVTESLAQQSNSNVAKMVR